MATTAFARADTHARIQRCHKNLAIAKDSQQDHAVPDHRIMWASLMPDHNNNMASYESELSQTLAPLGGPRAMAARSRHLATPCLMMRELREKVEPNSG